MQIDVKIERISNGYIFTGKGVDEGKCYYASLEDFAKSIVEDLREKDRVIREHLIPEEPFTFTLKTDL